jgi:hypothetical protein
MNRECRPTKEFIDYCLKVNNDTKFQNEKFPALKFWDNSKKYLNIDIIDLIENKNDPPDFDIILSDKSKISLEVTSFTDKSVQKYNSFFRSIECGLRPILSKYIHIISTGIYEFYYFPGAENTTITKSMHIEIPDFKFKVGKDELLKQLEQKVPDWFQNYPKSKQDRMSVLDKDGNQVGKIVIIKWVESDKTRFSIVHQSYKRYEEWKDIELDGGLQNVVTTKEQKYIKKMNGLKSILKTGC